MDVPSIASLDRHASNPAPGLDGSPEAPEPGSQLVRRIARLLWSTWRSFPLWLQLPAAVIVGLAVLAFLNPFVRQIPWIGVVSDYASRVPWAPLDFLLGTLIVGVGLWLVSEVRLEEITRQLADRIEELLELGPSRPVRTVDEFFHEVDRALQTLVVKVVQQKMGDRYRVRCLFNTLFPGSVFDFSSESKSETGGKLKASFELLLEYHVRVEFCIPAPRHLQTAFTNVREAIGSPPDEGLAAAYVNWVSKCSTELKGHGAQVFSMDERLMPFNFLLLEEARRAEGKYEPTEVVYSFLPTLAFRPDVAQQRLREGPKSMVTGFVSKGQRLLEFTREVFDYLTSPVVNDSGGSVLSLVEK